MLWFAWKIVLLQYRKQPQVLSTMRSIGCDLLGKSYFCSIANNRFACQQLYHALWFAWKIVLLQYRKQLKWPHMKMNVSCDLLGKSYFCSIANNSKLPTMPKKSVVICLENRTFAVSQTTARIVVWSSLSLWFAWKIVLLQYRKQLRLTIFVLSFRCDLLGKSYFCSIANNITIIIVIYLIVVICLENRTFAVSQTTALCFSIDDNVLWFAWKIVLLQYRKQHHLQ